MSAADHYCAFLKSAQTKPEVPEMVRNLLASNATKILDDFYNTIRQHDALSRHLRGDDHVATLKQAQKNHWGSVFADTLPEDFPERAARIGDAHCRIGLESGWYLGAYGWVATRLSAALIHRYRFQPAKLESAMSTMLQRMFTDMVHSLSAYEGNVTSESSLDHAHEEEIRHLRNLAATVTDVNEVAVDLARLSQNSHDVNFNAQSIAAAVAELVASVEDIARSSEGATEQASQTDAIASVGRAAVQDVSNAIRNISSAVEETAASVDELARASEQIGQILGVIENIAQQTNLLALNATIESARAGEAGRGFGVVATEVKGLANQTSRATEDISSRITSLRGGMNIILKTMERSKTAVRDGQGAIHSATDTIEQIAAQIGEVSHNIREISGILAQQQEASAEIGRNIEKVAGHARENDHLLADMSGKLQDSNARFVENSKEWFKAESARSMCEMAKIDHVLFKKRIVDVLIGHAEWAINEVPDHHSCRFGKWYDAVQIPQLRDLASFKALIEPHKRVHETAKAALQAHARHDTEAALAALGDMNKASGEVLALLDEISTRFSTDLAGLDRRRDARYKSSGQVELDIDGRKITAELKDISKGGMRVDGVHKVNPGTQVRVEGEDLCCVGEMRWSENGQAGIEFKRKMSDYEMKKITCE